MDSLNPSLNPGTEAPRVTFVIPAKNEGGSIAAVIEEIETVCAALAPFEIVVVDDGSTDSMPAELARLCATRPWLQVRRHAESCGKSAGLLTGARAARGPVLVTLDGDGQNDPNYVPAMVAALEAGGPRMGLTVGQRLRRGDSTFKKYQSRIANKVRGALLKDGTRDSVCGLKVVRRDVFLVLPFFDGLHRFLPALVKREGYDITHVDVIDRPRFAGQSHYGLFNRLWVGIADMLCVWWLIRRRPRVARLEEVA